MIFYEGNIYLSRIETFIIVIHVVVFQWESGTVIHLAWSSTEELLCIQDDGQVLVYDIFGNIKRHFSMGQVCVIHCHFEQILL